jgi:long-chain fatty acid transport protein
MLKHALAFLVAAPAVVLADGYIVPNVNPRDLAMAGSRVAAEDTAAAAYVNPSALATIPGLNLSLAGSIIDFASTWSDPLGSGLSTRTETNLVTPPALFASWGAKLPNDMRYGVGVGFNVPGGGNVFWPSNWPGQFDILTVDRRIYGTYLTAGLEPLPWLRVGGGAIYYRGTEKLSQRIVGTSDVVGTLATSGDAFAYDVSAEVQPIPPLRIGIDYKHKGDMRLTGHAVFTGTNPPAELAPLTLDQTVSHDLTFPNTLAVGASYRVVPQVLLSASFTWDRALVYKQDAFLGGAGARIIVPRNYHNGHTYRLGGEVAPVDKLKVRLGVLRNIAPTPAEWLSPTIPDANVWAGAVGASYEVVRGFTVEAAYYHAFFDEVTTPRGADGNFNVFPGTYDTHANIASLGITWAVPLGPSR